MKTRVIKTGNSRAVLVPASLADSLGWEPGKEVELSPLAGGFAVREPGKRNVARAVKRVIRDHEGLFRELARR
jgi:antitoxin component of MazEF toxin-antitoxin module